MLALSVDRGSAAQAGTRVKSYVSRKRLTFLNLLDPESSTAAQYGVRGVPMNFFINPQGKVVAFASGYRTWDGKDGLLMIEQLLSTAGPTTTGK